MKRINTFIFLVMILFCVMPSLALAHPGRTDDSGCHYCRTNCTKWGLADNEYHCHNGNTYTNSSGQVFNADGSLKSDASSNKPKTTTKATTVKVTAVRTTTTKKNAKSDDNTLKSVIVNGDSITVADKMYYETFDSDLDIVVQTNDLRATYDISNNSVDIGDNSIIIKVYAESGAEKDYTLIVTRNHLSNNTNISVFVDGEKVEFIDNKANVYVSSDTENFVYDYVLEDEKANIESIGGEELQFGDNSVILKVIAEDGTETVYEITVHKYTAFIEIISAIVCLVMLGGIILIVYKVIKK